MGLSVKDGLKGPLSEIDKKVIKMSTDAMLEALVRMKGIENYESFDLAMADMDEQLEQLEIEFEKSEFKDSKLLEEE